MAERKTPAERLNNYLDNEVSKVSAKFPAFNTNATTSALVDMVSDADNSGAQTVPPLDIDPLAISGGGNNG